MKILEFVDGIDSGGAGKIVCDYMKFMDKSDMLVDVLTTHKSDHRKQFLEDSFRENGCNVIYISNRKEGFFRHLKEFRNVIEKGNYDLIHCHTGDWSFPYLLIAKRYNIPVRIAHSHITKCGYSGVKKAIVTFMKCVLPIVTTHRYACGEEAGRYLWGNKSFVIMNNAVNCDSFRFDYDIRREVRQSLEIKDNCIVVMHIGRFCYQKNNEFFIKIADELIKGKREFIILMIGTGHTFDMIKNEISVRGFDKYFRFLGLRSDIPQLLMAADVFALPSRYEGLPIVAIEAQASGVKTIMSSQITREANILDTTQYLTINDDAAQQWANLINNVDVSDFSSRELCCEIVKNAGYDIKTQSEMLKEQYLSYISPVCKK